MIINDIICKDMEDIWSRDIDWNLLDNQTVLVTGVTGMIGSYILMFLIYLKKFKSINIHIVGLVRSRSKLDSIFRDVSGYSEIDIIESNLRSVEFDYGELDYVIHAASLSSTHYFNKYPVDVLIPNTIGTYNLLELAMRKKVKGFLFLSTGNIYGKISNDVTCLTENIYGSVEPVGIQSSYSESKRMGEAMCWAYAHQYGVPTKIARVWNTYAPTMDIDNDPRVFTSFVSDLVKGKDISMKSDGKAMRTYCYATDAIAGYFTILLKGKQGEAYNVCNSSQFLSVVELANIILSLRKDIELRVVRELRDGEDEYIENTLMKDNYSIPASDKLEKLGWKARVGVREGFDRVYNYIRKLNKCG